MFRVATYNIRKAVGTDRARRPDRILSVLGEIDADIVAVQEADGRFGDRVSALPAELMSASAYVHAGLATRSRSIGWHGNAILVRAGLGVANARRIVLPTLEPRGTVAVEVTLDDHTVRIVGMHLDLSGLRRRQQAHAILATLARLPPMPTVIMGDTNEWRRHGGCLHDFANAYRFAPTGPSFHSRRPVARLDRIMATPDLHIVGCDVHRSADSVRASDHLPIWADLAFAG